MVRKKKDPAKDPYREKLTRYHRMIEQAVEDAFTKYSRNVNRKLYLYYHPASGKVWGHLYVQPEMDDYTMASAEVRLVTTEHIPRNLAREGLYDWMRNRLRHLPLFGA